MNDEDRILIYDRLLCFVLLECWFCRLIQQRRATKVWQQQEQQHQDVGFCRCLVVVPGMRSRCRRYLKAGPKQRRSNGRISKTNRSRRKPSKLLGRTAGNERKRERRRKNRRWSVDLLEPRSHNCVCYLSLPSYLALLVVSRVPTHLCLFFVANPSTNL